MHHEVDGVQACDGAIELSAPLNVSSYPCQGLYETIYMSFGVL